MLIESARRYQLDIAALRAMNDEVRAAQPDVAAPELQGEDQAAQKILSDFFDGQRLKTIPVQRTKRLVVLSWLAEQFAAEREYPERDVNAILLRHHPDSAALRRDLIDEDFMTRDHGVYRKI